MFGDLLLENAARDQSCTRKLDYNNNNNNNNNNKLYFYSVYINNCCWRFTILLKHIKIQFKNYNNKRIIVVLIIARITNKHINIK